MNNARMWTVVNPTVGLPLFFVGIAATSLIVHASVLSSTNFMEEYWSGEEMGSTEIIVSEKVEEAKTAALTDGEAFIVLPDGRTGRVVFDAPVTLASADAELPLPAQ